MIDVGKLLHAPQYRHGIKGVALVVGNGRQLGDVPVRDAVKGTGDAKGVVHAADAANESLRRLPVAGQQAEADGVAPLAEREGIELLAQVPLVMGVSDGGDNGRPAALTEPVTIGIFEDLARKLTDKIK